jgi:hypothetical protein
MDVALATLEHRIAEAADAWLTDPLDTATYARLVAAVRARREHRRITAAAVAGRQPDEPVEPVEPDESDESAGLVDDVVQERPVVRLGAGLSSDPKTALEQLLGRRPHLASEHSGLEAAAGDGPPD